MADPKCHRCAYRSDAGPRDVRERVRCYPRMVEGGPEPFWMAWREGGKQPHYQDLDGSEVRCSEDCPRFKEQPPRRAPVQGDRGIPLGAPGRRRGTVAWSEHLSACEGYCKRYGSHQSAEDVAARGGFGYAELVRYLGHVPETWEPL